MSVDIYYRYDFSYNKNLYMETLKKVLYEKGINNLNDFRALLLKCGCESYETAKSYFNLRRVIPLNILGMICNYLNISSDEIMFPNSIPKFEYTKGIGATCEELDLISTLFQSVFIFDSPTSPFINTLSLVLSKYNYLLQKYYYGNLSNIELKEMGNFSINFLMDKKTNKLLNWKDFLIWKNELRTDDFLNDFYNKYMLVCLNPEDGEMWECKVLLQNKKTKLNNKLFNDLNNLLPYQERII